MVDAGSVVVVGMGDVVVDSSADVVPGLVVVLTAAEVVEKQSKIHKRKLFRRVCCREYRNARAAFTRRTGAL